MKFFINNLKFFKPKLTREEFDAYFNRLPENISVGWFRSDKFIIGQIEIDGQKFMTQAESADEFVDMINDTLLAVYEIPKEYFDVLLNVKKFMPNRKEFETLNNIAIKSSSMHLKKEGLVTT